MGAMISLNNHTVWENLSEVVEGIDANALVLEHLALCDYQISGYWDESDRFYENILLPRPLSPQLISSGLIFNGDKRRIQLKFTLNIETATPPISIAQLMLVYDENLEFIDENWQIDLKSELIQVQA
ncbi:hypothetical protein N39L_39400 [Limnospira platensis NIES-39]|jgi:hypothetical protein|uniref:Nuclear transport factor 2 family protein n=2 Tax=Limnospira platensis TaxID=118562 RepID=A0A5M3SYE6_LIMPL|nr:hypothetical protein NIES39_K02380 [Arthrospira platensis NIES-39]BDT14217.1 hypothetical protein N39L_39400 [Arthrospira platensis NIES-39]GCE92153.1 hypothetical protein NIES46_01880 [Arthrospira platensis NIES-46]